MERHGQLSSFDESHRLLLEAEDELYNDQSDLDLLAAFYKDKDEQDRRRTTDVEDTSATTTSTTKSGVYDVIIVGAGWAGLSAAMTLKAKGITNFIVLEAKDHIGGRSYTTNESFNGQNIPIDTGSMWIHGGTSNPLYPILTTVGGIPTSESTFPERMYKSNGGGAYTNSQLNTYYDTLYENGFFAYQERRQESTDVDETLQSTANKYLSTVSSTEGKTIAKYFMRSNIELEYSGSMSDVSFDEWQLCIL
jgi:choline dehydrogenase-like flavoprotein